MYMNASMLTQSNILNLSSQVSVCEQLNFHIHKFNFEVKEKPFSVMLDSDFDNIIENVLRYVRTYVVYVCTGV